ncbi:hypothetical protein RchiOBHm_Chr7g0213831 [Rosa chinensis]|uniref:Uncharacterized protein n=1 Tax=Rosa chinensis TaxID=74649 RepID=A0A2P6PB29_ROSCH|nr:hypothetical protein RchiOBHm_Chr7g0213831 [Rosa chinensis]
MGLTDGGIGLLAALVVAGGGGDWAGLLFLGLSGGLLLSVCLVFPCWFFSCTVENKSLIL